MAAPLDDREHVYPGDRPAWRAWLRDHHATSPGIWLVLDKKASRDAGRLTYDAAVEEALCFGWIDGLARTLDGARYRLLLTPRRPGSPWSRPNKTRVEALVAQGLMTAAGLARIDAAKADGSWTALDAVEDLVIPPDLAAALAADPAARRHFDAFSDSAKKGILWWIVSAKRPETRARRVRETVEQAAVNVRARG
jgi:uncharacterized protein YdeI (YjbR/CyaY-like superfamily)